MEKNFNIIREQTINTFDKPQSKFIVPRNMFLSNDILEPEVLKIPSDFTSL